MRLTKKKIIIRNFEPCIASSSPPPGQWYATHARCLGSATDRSFVAPASAASPHPVVRYTMWYRIVSHRGQRELEISQSSKRVSMEYEHRLNWTAAQILHRQKTLKNPHLPTSHIRTMGVQMMAPAMSAMKPLVKCTHGESTFPAVPKKLAQDQIFLRVDTEPMLHLVRTP